MSEEPLRLALAPWYGWIKALHVFAAMAWAWSTAVAWIWYLKPAFRRARARPDDEIARRERDRMMERFDRGAIVEHVAFVVLLVSGLVQAWVGGFTLLAWTWLGVKLAIVALVFVPMEIVDVHLSHFGGNKERARRAGDLAKHGRLMQQHWLFFRITEPIVATLIPFIVFLAVAKPGF